MREIPVREPRDDALEQGIGARVGLDVLQETGTMIDEGETHLDSFLASSSAHFTNCERGMPSRTA